MQPVMPATPRKYNKTKVPLADIPERETAEWNYFNILPAILAKKTQILSDL
jgi:hypothetical protein